MAARLYKDLAKGAVETKLSIRQPYGTFTTSLDAVSANPVTQATENRPAPLDLKVALDIFTNNSIRWTISPFIKFKSPGADEIFSALLQKGVEHFVMNIVKAVRESHVQTYVPNKRRTKFVIIIPKVGRRDHFLAKLKSMERLDTRTGSKSNTHTELEDLRTLLCTIWLPISRMIFSTWM